MAGAHLAAGCPRGSADRRLHGAGRHHSEDRRLRFPAVCLPILPDASRELAPLLVGLSLVAVVYIGLVALVQTDMKKLVAYSSISHMGFVTLGMFLFTGNQLNQWAVEGALVQMVSHGFVSAAMFMCIGVMYDRLHTATSPTTAVWPTDADFAAFMMLFAMANSSLPATSGFVGEFMVIMGAVQVNFWVAAAAATTLIFGAAYTPVDVQAGDFWRRWQFARRRDGGRQQA